MLLPWFLGGATVGKQRPSFRDRVTVTDEQEEAEGRKTLLSGLRVLLVRLLR